MAEIKTPGKLGNCECSQWETGAEYETDGQPDMDIFGTGCEGQTKRIFCQGHDAKLKSLFIRAGVEGWSVRRGRESGVLTSLDPEDAAALFGFGEQVRAGILSRLDKRAKSGKSIAPAKSVAAEVVEGSEEGDAVDAAREQYMAELATSPELTESDIAEVHQDALTAQDPRDVRAKVGRWEYEGTVTEEGHFAYYNKKDEQAVAAAGTFTILEELEG